jgi:hypothetical protein
MDWLSQEGEELDIEKLREEFILILDTYAPIMINVARG